MHYIEQLSGETRENIVDRAAKIAKEPITLEDHELGIGNEIRANKGQAAVMVGCHGYAIAQNGIRSDTVEAISNVIHFMHRAGLDPDDIWDSAKFSAEGDLEDGDEASRNDDAFPESAH